MMKMDVYWKKSGSSLAIRHPHQVNRSASSSRITELETMEDAVVGRRYWCYLCSQIVSQVVDVDFKCPNCRMGFVVEMTSDSNANTESGEASESDHPPLSLGLLSILNMLNINPLEPRIMRRYDPQDDDTLDNVLREIGRDCESIRRRIRRSTGFVEEMFADGNTNTQGGEAAESVYQPLSLSLRTRRLRGSLSQDDVNDILGNISGELSAICRELQSVSTTVSRSSVNVLQLLQGMRFRIPSELENDTERNGEEGEAVRVREHAVSINPFNQTTVLQGSNDGPIQNNGSIGSLGDYAIGQNIDLLLQLLVENDPNRYGTLPAKKEAVGAMPSVKVNDMQQCPICLDYFEMGADAKEMPCNHKFHDTCILPWLELHSSCPVCRYQLPADESKLNISGDHEEDADVGSSRDGSGTRSSTPWPFAGLFSFQTRGSTATSSSTSASTSSSARRQQSR